MESVIEKKNVKTKEQTDQKVLRKSEKKIGYFWLLWDVPVGYC